MNTSKNKKIIITMSLNLLALMELIDLTISSIAIPHIMGTLSANLEDVSLVMSNYMLATAIVIPISGIIITKFGIKKLAIFSGIVFTVTSVLCAVASTIYTLAIFRFLQGCGGAFLPSIAQSYITNNFDSKLKAKMLNLHGICLILGPIIGPSIGSIILENTSWRWIFYINLPICLGSILVLYFLMDNIKKTIVKIDYISFGFLSISVALFEYFIDKGNMYGWLNSNYLISILVFSILFIIFFVWRALLGKSIINFKLFRYKNYSLSCLAIFIFMTIIMGTIALFPTLLQTGYNFSTLLTGNISIIRGIAGILGSILSLWLSKRFDSRYLIFINIMILALATYLMTKISAEINISYIVFTIFIQGLGVTGIFINFLDIAYYDLPKEYNNDAAGMHNFFRNFGESIGTSIAVNIIVQQQQKAWNDVAANINTTSPSYQNLNILQNNLLPIIENQVKTQSFLIANTDLYYFALIGTLLIAWIPFFLIKSEDKNSQNLKIK